MTQLMGFMSLLITIGLVVLLLVALVVMPTREEKINISIAIGLYLIYYGTCTWIYYHPKKFNLEP